MKKAGLVNNDVVETVGRERRYRFTTRATAATGNISAATISGASAPASTPVPASAAPTEGRSRYNERGASTTHARRRALIQDWLEKERVIPFNADAMAEYARRTT